MMYSKALKVLIADDEYLICELLKEIIKWDELNLNLEGFVNNGVDLLNEIEKQQPDIVITDICMPGMDGIELIKQVRCKNIPCQFIIVSGYRQFEYAHNALKYDVDDYILKPIDDKEINDALRKLADSLRSVSLKNTAPNTSSVNNGFEKMKGFFLNRIIWEIENSDITLTKIQQDYNISFSDGLYQIIHIKLDVIEKSEETIDNLSSLDQKLIYLFKNTFEKNCHQILIDTENNYITAAINYDMTKIQDINTCIKSFYEHARNILDMFLGIKITLGIGNAYKLVTEFAQSYRDAENALYYRMVIGIDNIIYWNKINSEIPVLNATKYNEVLNRLKKDFEILDIDDFKECIHALFFIPKKLFPCLDILMLIKEISKLFINIESSYMKSFPYEDYIKKQIHYGIINSVSPQELEAVITEPFVSTMAKLLEETKKQNAKPIRTALLYIENNYFNPIKLEDVAKEVNLNAVYFSNIFKKEVEENFTDYLCKYRIDIAKDLLRNTSKNINEISESIGYSEARYFSKLFKKIVGIKPSEYRKIYS